MIETKNRISKLIEAKNRLVYFDNMAGEEREVSRREEEQRRQMKEENTVRVKFSADFYYTNYAGRHDRSDTWYREITKDEYNALVTGGASSIANYIRSNLLDTRVFPKDSVITRATMQKM